MKKIAGKIAMVLVLVMLANSFTGCSAIFPHERWAETFDIVLGVAILVIAGVASLFLFIVEPPDMSGTGSFHDSAETGVFLTSAENNSLTDYCSIMEIINSLSETEKTSLIEKINSLSETKQSSLIKTVKSLPKSEIASSIDKLKALSDKKLSITVRNFNALSEDEIDFLMKKLNEKANSVLEVAYADTVNFSHQKPYLGTRLCLQY